MSEIDQIKEEIGWLKVLFALLVASGFSLGGWFTLQAETATTYQVWIAIIGITIDITGIILVNRAAYKRIQKLRDL